MISVFPPKGSLVCVKYESRSRYSEHTIKSRNGILSIRSPGTVTIEDPRSGYFYSVRRESIVAIEVIS